MLEMSLQSAAMKTSTLTLIGMLCCAVFACDSKNNGSDAVSTSKPTSKTESKTAKSATAKSATAKSATAKSATPKQAGSSEGTTIEYDPETGKTRVKGKTLDGDPKDCAAFEACCAHSELGLFCGMAQAASKSCSEALETTRRHLKERGLKPPPGC